MSHHELLRLYRQARKDLESAVKRLDLIEQHLALYYWRETNKLYDKAGTRAVTPISDGAEGEAYEAIQAEQESKEKPAESVPPTGGSDASSQGC